MQPTPLTQDVNHDALVAETEQVVAERMLGQQAGHGMDHVLRVLRTTREIQTETGGDRTVAELAALLHDVGDAKFHQGVERSAEFSAQILASLAVDRTIIEQVLPIVENISFRKGFDARLLSLEGKIVQDADRLDALGAIGIVRTIEYGSSFNQPFYAPGELKTGVAHFHEKLFKLRDLMNTETARRIALDRERFMRNFLEQFFLEQGHELPEEFAHAAPSILDTDTTLDTDMAR